LGSNGRVSKFWGVDAENFDYVLSTSSRFPEELLDGDSIVAFFYRDTVDRSDVCVSFSEDITAYTGEEIKFGLSYSARVSGATPKGADVTVYSATGEELKDMATKIDENAKITLTFTSAGTYTVEVSGTCNYTGLVWDNAAGEYVSKEFTNAQIVPARVTVTVKDAPVFKDIEGHWGYDAIVAMYDAKIMDGVGDGYFKPDMTLSRGMLVTMLYRADGSNKTENVSGFTDVEEDDWYYDAVNWAAENGILLGDNGKASPNSPVTREQAAAFIYRYAAYKGMDTTASLSVLDSFSDVGSVSTWAKDAMAWVVSAGIVNGRDGNRLAPSESASRAEAARMLCTFLGK
jgi:hypothetical protein